MAEHVDKPGLGKFEGEPCYAEFYYGQYLDGGAGAEDWYEGDTLVSVFVVTAENVTQFPCCLDAEDVGKVVLLTESDQGFINTELVTADEATKRGAQAVGAGE